MSIPAASEAPPPLAPLSTDFLAAQRANRAATTKLLLILTAIAAIFGYVLGWVVETFQVTGSLSKSMKNPDVPDNLPVAATQILDWQAQHNSPWHFEDPQEGKKTGAFMQYPWDPVEFTPEGIKRMGH